MKKDDDKDERQQKKRDAYKIICLPFHVDKYIYINVNREGKDRKVKMFFK